jgi:cation diffusion facilitator CzcD-associated flavoprotein CzcO
MAVRGAHRFDDIAAAIVPAMERVGIIGAGPAGIVAARYLITEGFDPVLFERSSVLGGQWSGSAGTNGVWPTLHTNTSRVLTAFSDLPHDGGPVFPSNHDIRRYLERYARAFGVFERIRFETPVERLERDGDGWLITTAAGEERCDRVIVASGRFHRPHIPHVPGLDGFTGAEGVLSTYDYKEPDRYRGQRVLVGGCAVSAMCCSSSPPACRVTTASLPATACSPPSRCHSTRSADSSRRSCSRRAAVPSSTAPPSQPTTSSRRA